MDTAWNRRSAAIGALALGTACAAADGARLWANERRVALILAARDRANAPHAPVPTPTPATAPSWWDRLWRLDQAPIRPLSDADYRVRLEEQVAAIEAELAERARRRRDAGPD
jgi:hypothetical protein